MKTSAERIQSAAPLFFASLSEKITTLQAKGIDPIRLDIGSPDMPPAAHIRLTMERSLANDASHGYQPHKGSLSLRQAWVGMYKSLYTVVLDPDSEVLPLLGSKEGIFHLPLALIDPQDIVLLPDPGYITYTQGALIAGGEPYYLPLLPDNAFLPDLSAIPGHILKRARLLWLNYPNNPTAAVAPLEFFVEAVHFARKNNLLVCHDAAYSQVSFDGYKSPSILQVPGAKEWAVEFNTLSKSHNMAGWRVGVAVGSRDVLASLYTLKTNADSGQFLPVLQAAEAAMTGDQSWLVERNLVYQQRRDMVMHTLESLGLQADLPKASLYVWFHVPMGWTSMDFAGFLLDNAYVSVTPGIIFGKHGEGYIRLSLTAPIERLAEAMERIRKVMEQAS